MIPIVIAVATGVVGLAFAGYMARYVLSQERNIASVTGRVKAYFMYAAGGPLVILTSCDSVDNPEFLEIARSKGYTKFIAHEIPVELAKARYGMHFNVVCKDPHESDILRVLDYEGKRVWKTFSFEELGPPIYYETFHDGAGHLRFYQRDTQPAAELEGSLTPV